MRSPDPRIAPDADTTCSVVSESGGEEHEPVTPAYFGDLNLDQVAVAFSEGMPAKDLDSLFMTALQSVDAVDYRHEVVRDLYSDEVVAPIRNFVNKMHRMRQHLGHVDESRHRLQRQALFLEAVEGYCDAVASLDHGMHGITLDSR